MKDILSLREMCSPEEGGKWRYQTTPPLQKPQRGTGLLSVWGGVQEPSSGAGGQWSYPAAGPSPLESLPAAQTDSVWSCSTPGTSNSQISQHFCSRERQRCWEAEGAFLDTEGNHEIQEMQ